LAGLDALDEAVGRSAEMGSPAIVNIGSANLQSAYAPATMAGLVILGHVTRLAIDKGVTVIAPQRAVDNIPVAREVMRESYMVEGEEALFNAEEQVLYTPTQASISALSDRLLPAVNIMIGNYAHEAIIYAEAFGRIGAIQVGGTTKKDQVYMFAAVCDYTLIGEEIIATRAYLEREPMELSTIRATDLIKIVLILISLVGSLLITAGNETILTIMNR
jgi:hypothetical protein